MTFRWLLRGVEWLDKRFPPKVTITDEKYAELEDRLARCLKAASGFQTDFMILNDRVKAGEKSIAALKELIVKGGAGGVSEIQRRAQFIADGRMPAPAETA